MVDILKFSLLYIIGFDWDGDLLCFIKVILFIIEF